MAFRVVGHESIGMGWCRPYSGHIPANPHLSTPKLFLQAKVFSSGTTVGGIKTQLATSGWWQESRSWLFPPFLAKCHWAQWETPQPCIRWQENLFLYPFVCQGTVRLFLCLVYSEQCHSGHGSADIFFKIVVASSLDIHPKVGLLKHPSWHFYF